MKKIEKLKTGEYKYPAQLISKINEIIEYLTPEESEVCNRLVHSGIGGGAYCASLKPCPLHDTPVLPKDWGTVNLQEITNRTYQKGQENGKKQAREEIKNAMNKLLDKWHEGEYIDIKN